MATIVILAGLALVGLAAARLVARAVEAEHLLVLWPDGGGVWLFERDGDRRYHRLPLAGLPAALCRFVCGVPAVVRARSGA
jgi:hypothetical protein